MTPIQFFIIGFAILILIKTGSDLRKNKISLPRFLFWVGFWLLVLVVAILPHVTNFFAQLMGVGKGSDLVVYFAMLVIFLLLFKIFARLEKIEHEITKIVRELSLKDFGGRNLK